MYNHRLRITGLCVFALFAIGIPLAFLAPAVAQEVGASVAGTVQDSTGAAVANATLSATNVATNERVTTKSQADGEYTLLNLQPGTYSLGVTAEGFSSYQRTGIILNLNQHARVNVALQLGAVQQQVTVNADVSNLDTSSSEVAESISGVSISNLPLNTRESYSLLQMVPGYSGSVGNNYNDVSYSVDGGNNQYGDVLVDGTPAGFPTVNGYQGIGIFPSVDAIGEFRLLAQNFPAEFGRTLDGILNVVFKSGTNDYHGTAFEFIRNSALDANDYFSNLNERSLPPFRRNQFGGVFDGPIFRNKTFFLLSTELLRQNSFQSLTTTVPTDLQRQGDFSQTYSADGKLTTIYNPFSTRPNPNGTGYIRDPFANNVIPQQFMSNIAVNALKYYPEPNTTGDPLTNANNYFANGSVVAQTTSWDVRIDHSIGDRQKIFGRYSNRYYASDPNPLFPKKYAVAEGLINSENLSRGLSLGYTATINPQTFFDWRLGFARTLYDYANTSEGFDATSLGLPGTLTAAAGNPRFPVFAPNGYFTLGNSDNRHNAFMTYSMLSSLTLERGKHIFKLGFDSRIIRVNDNESRDTSGDFSFGRGWSEGPDPNTASADSGNGLASMLLGTGTGDMIQNYKNAATQSYYIAGYLQDDWRIMPNLTLNLGVRYDIDTPRTERHNRMNYFDPTATSPLSTITPGLQGGLVFVGVDGRSRYQYQFDTNNVAPRVGFAYTARPSTVVHGGGAIVYGASNQAAAGTVGPYGFRVQNTWVSSLDGITPYHTLDNPFPEGFSAAPGASAGLLTGVGGAIEGVLRNSPAPYVVQWGLNVQQTLPYQMTADIAYVGNRGRQQIQSYEGGIDFDQLPTSYLSLGSSLEDTVANPFYGSITTGALSAATTSREQLLLKYPQFTSMEPLRMSGGNSQYDGLQLSLNKRLSQGVQIQGAYVWSRNFDNNSSHQDSFNPMKDYAISYQDIKQRFVMSYIYQLPFGRGRQFGSTIEPWEDAVLGGWQLNGITTVQGGTPLQISANNTLSQFNFQNLYADTNFQNASYSGAVKKRLNKYFNTADFSQPAAFTLGNGPAYYDNLRGPGYFSTDLSLFKQFHVVERLNAEFRAEAFNIFNHPEFGSPDTTVTDNSFGVITSQSNSPRQVQFGLKLSF